MDTPEQELFNQHVAEMRRRYDSILDATGYPAVVIAAGNPAPVFQDDQHLPFKANPWLLQWAPLLEHPGSVLTYRCGETPELLVFSPRDFWHSSPPLPAILDNSPIDLRVVTRGSDLAQHIKGLPGRTAFLGEQRDREDSFGLRRVNPRKLLEQLQQQRSRKTAWEIASIRTASHIAATGHTAAEQCFADGGSEYEIHQAFRQACVTTDNEMPYPAIVALNEHGATLHYQRLDRLMRNGDSLLIDAGASCNGYASDITRTYSTDSQFAEIIAALDAIQLELCAAALPGSNYRDLHLQAHHSIATLLKESGLVNSAQEETVKTGISKAFFPHGLGHYLGLQVHDVGAENKQEDVTEQSNSNTENLRLGRVLEPGNVHTIEPGLYFIDMLLNELRTTDAGKQVIWARVDELRRFGGIRIEDNIVITQSANQNLTREAFAQL